jgi:hypothetical protein
MKKILAMFLAAAAFVVELKAQGPVYHGSFIGNGAGLTNLPPGGGGLTNGQLGTVNFQGPLNLTNGGTFGPTTIGASGLISANGYVNNPAYGTTNNGVGFWGNGAGLTNLPPGGGGLTNGQLGTVDFQGPFNVTNTSSFFGGVVATGNSSVALSLTGDAQGDYIGNFQSHSGGHTLSIHSVCDLTLIGGTLSFTSGAIGMGGGSILATGLSNNPSYGITNNGVGFWGNGAGLTNLQGLVLPSYALTNFETADSSFVGFLYGQQTIFGNYLVATQTVTGLGGGYFYGNAFGSGGAPALNCWSDANTLPVAIFYQGLAGNQNNITMDGLADLVMNGGHILAQGYSNNAGYGTTNNGVGFWGNGFNLTNLNAANLTGTIPGISLPSNVLTNGQLGTVNFQGPFNVTNTSSFFGSVVLSNASLLGTDFLYSVGSAYIDTLHVSSTSGGLTSTPSALATNGLIVDAPTNGYGYAFVVHSNNAANSTDIFHVDNAGNIKSSIGQIFPTIYTGTGATVTTNAVNNQTNVTVNIPGGGSQTPWAQNVNYAGYTGYGGGTTSWTNGNFGQITNTNNFTLGGSLITQPGTNISQAMFGILYSNTLHASGTPTVALPSSANSAVTLPSASIGFWTATSTHGQPPVDCAGTISITNGNHAGTNGTVGLQFCTVTFSTPYIYPPVVTIAQGTNTSDTVANARAIVGAAFVTATSTTTGFTIFSVDATGQLMASGDYYTLSYQVSPTP